MTSIPQAPRFNGVIGIVGAGISGAGLAVALQKRGIRSVIFERDVAEDCRPQGYSLTLSKLEDVWDELGLRDIILENHCDTATYTTYLKDGSILHQIPTPQTFFLSRELLRKRLLSQLDPEFVTLHWDARVSSIDYLQDSVQVTYENGDGAKHTETFAGVVAGDGRGSKLRSLVLKDELYYTGVIIIIGTGSSTHEMFNHRMQMVDGFTRMFCKPHSKGRSPGEPDKTYWQVTWPMKEDEFGPYAGREEAKEAALKAMSGWSPEIVDLVRSTPVQDVWSSLLYDRTPKSWETSLVTLIGDSAHPMSPFHGQGANMAMIDAVLLARAIEENPTDLRTAFATYERRMLEEATPKVLKSREATFFFHTPECVDREAVQEFWDIK